MTADPVLCCLQRDCNYQQMCAISHSGCFCLGDSLVVAAVLLFQFSKGVELLLTQVNIVCCVCDLPDIRGLQVVPSVSQKGCTQNLIWTY